MNKIEFIKMHGLGNDFVIIDRRNYEFEVSKNLINKISNRKTGAGCDQVIIIDSEENKNYSASIKIYNPNGDIAEACGNGTRCVAKILFEEINSKNIKIKSDAGILNAIKYDDKNISVNLGKISHAWNKIPLSKKLDTLNLPIEIGNLSKGIAVNVGNPHIVFIEKKIKNFDLSKYGPLIENHEYFPKKVNVEIIEVIDRETIKMRVWERGVGITLACGSGACASVYAGNLKNLIEKKVEVKLEMGSLFIEIINNEAIMTGPAEISYKGFIELQ